MSRILLQTSRFGLDVRVRWARTGEEGVEVGEGWQAEVRGKKGKMVETFEVGWSPVAYVGREAGLTRRNGRSGSVRDKQF